MTKEQYLKDPCRAASLPYRKEISLTVPENMLILHHDDFTDTVLEQYTDEPYFRLIHPMQQLQPPRLPSGYSLCKAGYSDFAAHLNLCYRGLNITADELQSYSTRPTFDASLWIAVRDPYSGEIAASGIAELDHEIGEGSLEWIQVSDSHRRQGLGQFIVCELLRRLKGKAGFVTVSGQIRNSCNPEKLCRQCSFSGNEIWHILRKK